MKKAQEPSATAVWTQNGLAFSPLYFHLSGAVTGVTGKNKTFIIIFATKSLIITCDTLEWIIVVAVHHYVVTRETSGALFVLSKSLLHCCAK